MSTKYTTRNRPGKPPGGLKLPQRQQSIAVSSSIPVPSTSAVTENASSRKSLLPQRTAVRSQPSGLRKPQIATQPTRNTEQQEHLPVETQPIPRISPETSQPAPGDANIPPQQPVTTNTNPPSSRPKTEPRTDRISTRSKSPVKSLQQNDTKPTVTKKPPIPPAARPTRSASLRQPSAPKISGIGEGKGHARHRSQVLSTGAAPVLSAPSRSQEKSGSGTTTAVKQSRPQFTTYQQHFSPKKEKEAPRTLPVGDRRNTSKSASGSEAVTLRPEIAALQTEFLQLYLLHSSSIREGAEWKLMAERQLRDKYYEVATSYRTLLEEESRVQKQLNLEALYDWSVKSASLAGHDNGVNFHEEIQSFSRLTQEVADMTADGSGRYALVVDIFEKWLERVEHIKRIRETQDSTSEWDPQYIDTLGSGWKNEVDDLTIKAELCLRELLKTTLFVLDDNKFCEKYGNSALVRLARGHRDVLTSMIDELKLMRTVESETVNLEQAWIARAADQVEVDRMGSRTGIWKRLS